MSQAGAGKDSATTSYPFVRAEVRVPLMVAVQITSETAGPQLEKTFTDNVSSTGARVVTMRRWQPDERLVIWWSSGSFHSLARVRYCQPLRRDKGFAIGVQFLEPTGDWVVNRPAARDYTGFDRGN